MNNLSIFLFGIWSLSALNRFEVHRLVLDSTNTAVTYSKAIHSKVRCIRFVKKQISIK